MRDAALQVHRPGTCSQKVVGRLIRLRCCD
jgi:hypothetical protein